MTTDKEPAENITPELAKDTPTILFDLGGVIVKNGFWDWVGSHTPEETQQSAYHSVIDAADAGQITEEECMKQLGELSHRPANVVSDELNAAYSPHEEVIEILGELKERKYPLVLVTNFMKGRANGLLDKYDLRKYFDKVFISSEMGLTKPSPEFFRTVNTELGISPVQGIFIDDSARNTEVATSEGITRSWQYTNPQDLRERFQQAHVLPPKTPKP
ncbi:MAG: HAD family phosphatase [Candidatus Levyibacteriota bacterium]